MIGERAASPGRVRRLVDRIDRLLRDNPRVVHGVLALLGVALLGVLGAAAWTILVELRSEQAAIDPRPAYVKAVQQKIHHATEAGLAGARARKLPASIKVTIQLDARGNLMSARLAQSSGDADLDELTLRIIRAAAPFEPFPPEMRRTTKILELNSEFHFH